MSESKHTKGPWIVRNESEIAGWSKTGKSWVVARTTAAKVGRDAANANARLIAAAPDLLAALEDSLYVGADEAIKALIRQSARDAIARAKGA